MRKRRKSFVLDSDVIEKYSWCISCAVNDDGSLSSLNSINIRDNEARNKKYKNYRKKYKQNHKEQTNDCQRKRYAESPEKYREYSRIYYWGHLETGREISRRYYAKHKEMLRRKRKRNYKLHVEERRRYSNEYKKTLNGRRIVRRYNAKRREYGFREINNWYLGTVGHHINDEEVIYIPEKVHRMYLTGETTRHRELIKEWLRNVRPDLYLRCFA